MYGTSLMQVPQFGIFAQGTIAHEFIEFDLRPDVEMSVATAALSRLRAPAVSAGGVNLVAGFGSDLWRAIAPEHAPKELRPFTPISAVGGHRAPATQHDFWLWINGSSRDVVFEHSRAAVQALADLGGDALLGDRREDEEQLVGRLGLVGLVHRDLGDEASPPLLRLDVAVDLAGLLRRQQVLPGDRADAIGADLERPLDSGHLEAAGVAAEAGDERVDGGCRPRSCR